MIINLFSSPGLGGFFVLGLEVVSLLRWIWGPLGFHAKDMTKEVKGICEFLTSLYFVFFLTVSI